MSRKSYIDPTPSIEDGTLVASSSGASTPRSTTPPLRSATPPYRSETPPPELAEKQKTQKKYADLCTALETEYVREKGRPRYSDEAYVAIAALRKAIFHIDCLHMSSEEYIQKCETAYQEAKKLFVAPAVFAGPRMFSLRRTISHSYIDPIDSVQLPAFEKIN